MVLYVDSDAIYFEAPKARSRVTGYYNLSDYPNATTYLKLNGSILVEYKTLRHVIASAAEAETTGIFHNKKVSIPIRNLLQALDHLQPPTPIKTDNSTSNGFIHDSIHQHRSKFWDMRYYWLKDRKTQQQFLFFWDRGSKNDADYFTKNQATSHHRQQRPKYFRDKS